MKAWAVGTGLGLVASAVLAGVAFIVPNFLDGTWLADLLLRGEYKMPELVASFVPELVQGMRLGLSAAAGCAAAGFVLWALLGLVRPEGPGQAGSGWRPVAWWLVLATVALAAFLACMLFVAWRLEKVDEIVAYKLSAGVAAGAAFAFWMLALIGTERMLRPAVPLGRFAMRAA